MQGHFAVGERVWMNGELFEIHAYNRDKVVLIPLDRSGYIEVVRPYYTQYLR